jgi:hypothetical protein
MSLSISIESHNVERHYVEHYAEFHYAECHYVEYHKAEYRNFLIVMLSELCWVPLCRVSCRSLLKLQGTERGSTLVGTCLACKA